MGLGRIVALIGSLTPAAEAPAQPEVAVNDRPVAVPAGAQAGFDAKDGADKSDAAAQIEAVISAIHQLHDHASQDGAGMAFSRSGASLRDSVGALGHLMAAARDTGVPLSTDLVKEAGAAVDTVEARLGAVEAGIEQRAHRLSATDEARVRDVAGRFVAEMQGAIAQTRTVIGRFG